MITQAYAAPGGVSDDLKLWLDADQGITGTTEITQWDDQSGNGKHVTQTNADYQPSFNPASSAMNFHPTIELDGDRDHLETSGVMSNLSDISFFIVTEVDGSSGNRNKFFGMGSSTDNPNIGFNSSGRITYRDPLVVFNFSSSQPMRYSEPLIFAGDMNYTLLFGTSRNYLNGVRNTSSPTTLLNISHGGNGEFNVGGSDNTDEDIDGRIAELVLYSSRLSTNERHQVETYLGIKYGISLDNDYLSAANSPVTVYDLNGSFESGIFGLAKDIDGNLDQRISRSLNDSSGLVLSTDTNFSLDNFSHADTINDNSYLLMGHNNNNTSTTQTSEKSALYDRRIPREWKVTQTGTVGAINMDFATLPSISTKENFVIVSDTDDNFSSGDSPLAYSSTGSFLNVTFSAGTSYYTLAVTIPVSELNTTITASPTSVTADGTTSSTITVQAKDASGSNLSTGGLTVTLSENGNGLISTITDNLDGTYTATITNTTAETITISGTIGGSTITSTETITFTPGSPDATQTTIDASPTSIVADGITTTSVVVRTKDAQGNDITTGGATLVLLQNGSALFSPLTDNNNGTYSATMTNTVAENIAISGTLSGTAINGTAAVTFTAGPFSNTISSIIASPTTVTANGVSSSTVTVQAKDSQGNNITTGGASVLLSTSGSAILTPVTDHGNGSYSASIANTNVQGVIVSAIYNGFALTGTANISFTAGSADSTQSSISAAPIAVLADGVATSTVTIQAKDSLGHDLSVGGSTVVAFTTGSAVITAIVDNGNGRYSATVTSTTAEVVTVSATLNGIALTDTDNITFTPGAASTAQTTITALPTSVTADGTSTSTLTVQTKDSNGNNVNIGGALVVLSNTGSATLGGIADNNDGSYTATLSSTVAEDVSITATLNGLTVVDNASVSFVAGSTASTAETLITVNPISITADGINIATITVQAKDNFSNNLTSGGLDLALAQDGSATISSITDNSNGTYTAFISSTVAENIIISATIGGLAVADTANIAFTSDAASVATSTLIAVPTSLIADGVVFSTVTLQAKDGLGNNLTTGGATVLFSTTSSANIGTVIDNADGTYIAEVTNTVSENITITATLNGANVIATTDIAFIAGAASLFNTTISASPTSLTADGISGSLITVQSKDAQGNNLVTGGLDISLASSGSADVSSVTDNSNGTYTATITNTVAESVSITGAIAGFPLTAVQNIVFNPGAGSVNSSSIIASPSTVTADGTSTSLITLQIKDTLGNNLTTGGAAVTLTTTGNAILSAITDIGDGSYTASISNATAEQTTISGTLAAITIIDTAVISFNPGSADSSTTSITVSDSTVTADGISTSTITVHTKDSLGNNLSSGGDSIGLSSSGNATISAITDNADGSYTATISNTAAEIVTITGSLNASQISDDATITFGAGNASAATSTLSLDTLEIVADGLANATITLQTKDAQGNNLTTGGQTVIMLEDGNAIISTVTDNSDGSYTATVSSRTAESVTISATLNADTVSNSVNLIFIPGAADATQTSISSGAGSVTADGSSIATVSIRARDSEGNNLTVGGDLITLSQSGSAILSVITDNGDGSYTATLTNTVAENVIVSGTINSNPITDTTNVIFNAGNIASVSTTSISATPTSLIADGSTSTTITVQAQDSLGNNINSGGLTIALTVSGSALLTPVVDNGNGTYTASLTNTIAETVVINGTLNTADITDTETIIFTAGNADPLQSIITSSGAPIANGLTTAQVTVQIRDSQGNNLSASGGPVILATSGSAILSVVTDNNDGSYQATLTNTIAETVTISGTLNSTPITDTATVTFIPGVIDAAGSTIIASPALVTANGVDVSLLTIQTYDALGNALITGGDVVVLSENNNAIISPVIDHLNGSYTASISNATVQTTTVTGTLNGTPIVDTEIIEFVPGGPAHINATDGRFINGIGPLGADIEIRDSLGNVVCSSKANDATGKYHCVIKSHHANGQSLIVTATDRANNSENSTILINNVDSDDDGISDLVETLIANNGGFSNTEPHTDSDGDKLPDYSEVILGSDFLSIDSPTTDGNIDIDVDGLSDAVEFYFNAAGGATDSELSTDTDGDGIPDITELVSRKSDFNQVNLPLINGSQDSDGDNVTDAVEFYLSTFFIVNSDDQSDYDNDGFSDAFEVRIASNPLHAHATDSDLDGVNDAVEAFLTTTINDNTNTALIDRDNDGLFDIFELSLSTDVTSPFDSINNAEDGDEDGDNISDAIEQFLSGNTIDAIPGQDTDNDGISDDAELTEGSHPLLESTPVIWIDVVNQGSGSVKLLGNMGGFQAPYPQFSWDVSMISAADAGASFSDLNARTLNITDLTPGKYAITLLIEKTISGQTLSSPITKFFTVSTGAQVDSDYDGISDAFDTFDGVLGSEETLHTVIGATDNYQMRAQYGVGLRAGMIARTGKNEIATISYQQLGDFIQQKDQMTAGNTNTNNNIGNTPNLFNIEMIDIPESGGAVELTIPLNKPLDDDATVLLFDHKTNLWAIMQTSSTENIRSSIGSQGNCPPPGDGAYIPGLINGSYCISVHIEDGGANDKDDSVNGSIPLTIGVGSNNTLTQENGQGGNTNEDDDSVQEGSGNGNISNNSQNSSSSRTSGGGSGGGSLNPWLLLALLSFVFFYKHSRLTHSAHGGKLPMERIFN